MKRKKRKLETRFLAATPLKKRFSGKRKPVSGHLAMGENGLLKEEVSEAARRAQNDPIADASVYASVYASV